MGRARSFTENSLALTIASLSGLILGAVYRIFIARSFEDGEFGKYVFITVYVSYFSVISLLGIREVVVRELAKAPGQYRTILVESFKIRGLSTLFAYIMAYGVLTFIHKGPDVELGMAIYGISLFSLTAVDLVEGTLIAKESSAYVTISALMSNVLRIGIGIWLLHLGYGLIAILTLFVLTSVFNFCLISWLCVRAFKDVDNIGGKVEHSVKRFLIKEALPFFYISLISKVYYKNDILLLSIFKGDKVVGWYGAAYVVIDALLTVAWSIVSASYPVMSKSYGNDREYLSRFHNMLSKYMMLLFLSAAIVLTVVGPELVSLVFGEKYSMAAPVVRVLAWMPAAEAVTVGMGVLLGSAYQQRVVVKLSILNAAINLFLCLVLIPKFSYMGAAVGTVASGYFAMAIVMYTVNKLIHKMDWWTVAGKPLLCALLACGIPYYFKESIGSYLTAIVSLATYAFAVICSKCLSPEDFRIMRSVLGRKTADQVGLELG